MREGFSRSADLSFKVTSTAAKTAVLFREHGEASVLLRTLHVHMTFYSVGIGRTQNSRRVFWPSRLFWGVSNSSNVGSRQSLRETTRVRLGFVTVYVQLGQDAEPLSEAGVGTSSRTKTTRFF